MESFAKLLSVADYIVFSLILLISLSIGLYTWYKGKRTTEDFYEASHSFSTIPVGMSLVTSFVSSLSILGFTAESYAYGIQLSLFVAGAVVGIVSTQFLFLNVIYGLKMTSINEYIDLRFHSPPLKAAMVFLCVVFLIFYLGACLYAPTIAMASVTPLSTTAYVFILGIICTLYYSFGGMRAVIWTDVFQLLVMLLGIIAILAVGSTEVGGLTTAWSIAKAGGRMQAFIMDASPYVRYTFLNSITFGFMGYSYMFGVSQIFIQRIFTVRSYSQAKKLLYFSGLGMIFIYFLIFTMGIVAYAVYAGCDPLENGEIEDPAQILPYFIMDKTGTWYGFPGLFIATLFCGTLSSLSSALNAVAAIIWKDILVELKFFSNMSEDKATIVNKTLSFLLGLIMLGTAMLASKTQNVVKFMLSILGVIGSPMYGVFIVGFFLPVCKASSALIGVIVSFALLMWASIGRMLYMPKEEPLPFSSDFCNSSLYLNGSKEDYLDELIENLSQKFENVDSSLLTLSSLKNQSVPLAEWYGVSDTYFNIFGAPIVIFVAIIVSIVIGFQDPKAVPKELINPYVRRFFYKEDLEAREVQMLNQPY